MTVRRKSGNWDRTVILVVDDEPLIRNVARFSLEKEGYFILASHDGENALHLSRKFPGTIHAVLSDVKMPKMNGLELRERILTERPGIKVMLMSGHTDAAPPGSAAFLPKPFTPAVLQERMRQLLASSAPAYQLVKNRRGMEKLATDKFKLGGDVSAARWASRTNSRRGYLYSVTR